jgi:hypothetical protein
MGLMTQRARRAEMEALRAADEARYQKLIQEASRERRSAHAQER